jgi:hypothetical protein
MPISLLKESIMNPKTVGLPKPPKTQELLDKLAGTNNNWLTSSSVAPCAERIDALKLLMKDIIKENLRVYIEKMSSNDPPVVTVVFDGEVVDTSRSEWV